MPTLYLADVPPHLPVQILDAIGGLEATPERGKQAQPVERQRFFEPFLKRTGGSAVDRLKLRLQLQEPSCWPVRSSVHTQSFLRCRRAGAYDASFSGRP